MAHPFTLFEISWEVCNKIGGIHTVLSTKAKTMVERFGDDYVAVGPWLLADADRSVPFDEDPGYWAFCESCREMNIPVRVGRWRIPGAPRTILVEFSRLYAEKDDVLARLWEDYQVDSISGQWDYYEPVLFGHAAGRVIERWWEEYLAPNHRRAVAHAHEWMTGSALLYLKERVPSIGTVFTTHATMLGRALSSLGHNPDDGLGDQDPEALARDHQVVAKHSIEGTCAREADVFTTVSEITAKEAELLHGRAPDPLVYNGIDLDVVDAMAGPTTRPEARAKLDHLAGRFLGEDVTKAAHLCISGRYEFHNKGLDVLLDALASSRAKPGRKLVLWVLVPAGNSGLRSELIERLAAPQEAQGAIGLSTHNLFDFEHDPVQVHCRELGLDNAAGGRVSVIQVPIYLRTGDGLLDLPYEAVLRGMDLACFPSYYEPWGYTPQEALAVGVPTITTDYAGFGRWAREQGLGPENGITVIARVRRKFDAVVAELAERIETLTADGAAVEELRAACREAAGRTAWSDLIANYERAWNDAIEAVQLRLEKGVPQSRRPKIAVSVQSAPEAKQPRLVPFDVSATLPESLCGLQALANDYWWCWDPEGASLFEELSPRAWEACEHNPVAMLQRVFPEDVEARSNDPEYAAKLARVMDRYRAYVGAPEPAIRLGQGADAPVLTKERPLAYFCAEFGIHESLRIYSGGLGILAGDHLKSASDLNLPFVAVGLFYRMGYLRQRVKPDGEQIAADLENDPRLLAMDCVRDEHGEPLEVSVQLPSRRLHARAWKVRVGRVDLYLLDTNTASNRPEDRDITRHLYGGDQELRLQQELVLGRCGYRLLRELGIDPAAVHINEGHAAFLSLQRVAALVKNEGLTFDEARELVRATTVFTTHTPVPAGHDRFDEDLIRRYFSNAGDWVGVPWERFYDLGRDANGEFNMTYLALNFASYVNGVSALHGDASRELLHPFWPGLLESEVPIRSITNGVHLPTWTSPEMSALLGTNGAPVKGDDFASKASGLPDEALWTLRGRARGRLLDAVRETLRRSFVAFHDSPLLLNEMLDGLREDALVIGFARRFAPYKRAHLLFKDLDRLHQLLDDEERPLRVIVAGKAHPRDELGKSILRDIVLATRRDDLIGRVFFVPEYDIALARHLVQGVDVWLNNPVRMQEASGTSGMKSAANGGLNLSIGDGWWPEAADGENGWTIGGPRTYDDQELQDQLDSSALYRLLEDEVIPLFFDRDANGIPEGWLERVRHGLRTIPPVFDTDRMVGQYRDEAYVELARRSYELSAGRFGGLKDLAREHARVRKAFPQVAISGARMADMSALRVGDAIETGVDVELGELAPSDVVVELVLGHARDGGDLSGMSAVALEPVSNEGGKHTFEGSARVERSGAYAYGIRVRPRSAQQPGDTLRDLVLWA